MVFDFKKENKELYGTKKKASIIDVPAANYLAVRGKGNPNEPDGAYQQAIKVLYGIAYTLRMSHKSDYKIEGFFEYVVPPLEGLWWQEGIKGYDPSRKDELSWISLIRLPDFVTKEDFDWAIERATEKKQMDFSSAEFYSLSEGLCVQMLHVGPFDEEPATVAIMDEFLEANGYEKDLSDERRHHEIYLSDLRKVASERLKTIIRHPIKKI